MHTIYTFGLTDYIIFALLLMLSSLTGLYFAYRHKIFKNIKEDSLKDYLTGHRSLKPFPVAMSLIASYISGVTVLGTPAEIYKYGASYWLIIIAMFFSGLTVTFVYLPVFTKLQVSSSYEYLELRFSKKFRIVASFCFLFDEIMFLPNLLYVPSLAFSQVSQINLHIISVTICGVCVFYTIMGGLKAVVYTDTWQTILMFVSTIVVTIAGLFHLKGFASIFHTAIEGERIEVPDLSFNMYDRYTVLSILIGGYVYWTAFNSVNQTMVQRYMSLSNERKSKISVILFTFGCMIFISLCCFLGLMVYATYQNCDPLNASFISDYDQILPYFVCETAKDLVGIPGLFIAGVFGAALSSLSVILNSSAVVLLEDFFKATFHFELSDKKAKIISRVIVFVLGAIACLLVPVAERLEGVFEVATSLSSVAAATMCGIFSLGMLVPWTNNTGAMVGGISGFTMSAIVAFGTLVTSYQDKIVYHVKPISVSGCYETYGLNVTKPEPPIYPDESNVFPLFKIFFLWIAPIGVITTMVVGTVVSFLTGKTDLKTLDPDLISPAFRWIMPEESKNYAGSSMRKIERQRLLMSLSLENDNTEMGSNT